MIRWTCLLFLTIFGRFPVSSAGELFWTVQGKPEIYRAFLDNREVVVFPVKGEGHPLGLDVDSEKNQIYFGWEDRDQLRDLAHKVSNGRPLERVYPNEINLKPLVDYGKILRSSFDLTEQETVFSTGQSIIMLDVDNYIAEGDEAPTSIALDLEKGKIYWGEFNGFRIRRCTLDGSNAETIIERRESGQPHRLAVDAANGTMYWTTIEGEVRCANLDGSDVKVLYKGENPSGIAIDSQGGKIYWTDVKHIFRSDLDGSNQEDLPIQGWNGRGGAIALDAANDDIYWADNEGKRIMRANLNRMEAEIVVPSTTGRVHSIALAQ